MTGPSQDPVSAARRFGLALGAALTLLGSFLLWRGKAPAPYLLGAAVLLALTALVAPRALVPLERLFARVARLVTAALTYVLLVVFFYLVVTPVGLLMRMFRKDPLGRKFDPALPSYWVPMEPDGPASRPEKPY